MTKHTPGLTQPQLPFPISMEQKFWQNVDKRGPDECWIWTGYKSEHGYGKLTSGRRKDGDFKLIRAHRFSYTLKHGPIPKGVEICHKCDNPSCVNPNHLFAGSHQDNASDMVAKGRQAIGNRLPWAKLTPSDIPRIRQLHSEGISRRKIAKQYGVSYATILDVIEGRTWKHVE